MRLFLITLVLLITLPTFSQNKETDTLYNKLLQYEAKKKASGITAVQLADTVKINILEDLCERDNRTDPIATFKYAEQELALASKLGIKKNIANAYKCMGLIYDIQSKYALSMEFYRKALALKLEGNDKIGAGGIYRSMGVVNGKQGNFSEALAFFLKGLQIAKQIKDEYGCMACYNNIGILYKEQNNYPEALKYYLLCVPVLEKMKDKGAMGVIYNNIGNIYLQQDKDDEALKYLTFGLKMSLESENNPSAADNYHSLGNAYLKKNDYPKALTNFKKALEISQRMMNGRGIARAYILLGHVYYKQADYKNGLASVKKGLDLVVENGELGLMKEGYQYLAEIYEAMGNYKMAYKTHILFSQVNDSIFNTEKNKKFSQLQLKYDVKSAQDSIKSVQYKKDIQAQIKATEQRYVNNLIYIILCVLVIFLVILIIQRTRIAKVKKAKALEEERSRISRELHDNLGAQLSTVRMFVSSMKNSDKKPDLVETSLGLLDASIADLRKVMEEMHESTLLDKGYLAATEELINKINEMHVIKFSLSHHKFDQRLSIRTEHQLYRVTQELINNTLKYAKASNVSLDLVKRDGQAILMYEDDGIGYDIAAIKKGYGLNNIETRIQSLGGNVEFDATPGAGSRTIIEIPL